MKPRRILATQDAADRYLTRVAGAMRDMPGHAGWYVMDERPFGHVPRQFHQYDVLRRADPTHPTYGVSNRPDELACWRPVAGAGGFEHPRRKRSHGIRRYADHVGDCAGRTRHPGIDAAARRRRTAGFASRSAPGFDPGGQ